MNCDNKYQCMIDQQL